MIFSLDLFAGHPRIATSAAWGTEDPRELAAAAIGCGVRHLLILDLARVGTGRGAGTSSLLNEIRQRHPSVAIAVGGGISRIEEVVELREAGANAVLIGFGDSRWANRYAGARAQLETGRRSSGARCARSFPTSSIGLMSCTTNPRPSDQEARAAGQPQVPDRLPLANLARLDASRAVDCLNVVTGFQVAGPGPARSRSEKRMSFGGHDRLAVDDQAQRCATPGIDARIGSMRRCRAPVLDSPVRTRSPGAKGLDRALAVGCQNVEFRRRSTYPRLGFWPLSCSQSMQYCGWGPPLVVALMVGGPLCGTYGSGTCTLTVCLDRFSGGI